MNQDNNSSEGKKPVLPTSQTDDMPAGEMRKGEQYILVNAIEAIVMRQVAEMMQYIEMCRCEKCFKDACALVLNQTPPNYVTTPRGTMLSQVANTVIDRHMDLNIKISQALNFVRENPKH